MPYTWFDNPITHRPRRMHLPTLSIATIEDDEGNIFDVKWYEWGEHVHASRVSAGQLELGGGVIPVRSGGEAVDDWACHPRTDGAPFATYAYDAYGADRGVETTATALVDAPTAAAIAAANVLRYAGYCYDAYAGLYYLSQRYYDPATASFTTKDPARADGEQSPYQYCGGDPVNQVDPTGEYSAALAVAYAKKWALSHNPKYPYFVGADCTNFASQVVEAGGIAQTASWYSKVKAKYTGQYVNSLQGYFYWQSSDTWVSATSFFRYAKSRGWLIGTVNLGSSGLLKKTHWISARPGDIIQFAEDPETAKHSVIVVNSTRYTGSASTGTRIAAHSLHRISTPWNVVGRGHRYAHLIRPGR